jgi:hypothetical protein
MVRGEHIGEPHVEIQDALGLVCFALSVGIGDGEKSRFERRVCTLPSTCQGVLGVAPKAANAQYPFPHLGSCEV